MISKELLSEVLKDKTKYPIREIWGFIVVNDNTLFFKYYPLHENYLHVLVVKMIVNDIFNTFEEELKKAYIEGSNDAWKAIKEKNANNTRTIPSA